MKKTLNTSGVTTNKDGIDYIKKFRETPKDLIKKYSQADLIKKVEEVRKEKLKKAS
jgi:hypothetical protein